MLREGRKKRSALGTMSITGIHHNDRLLASSPVSYLSLDVPIPLQGDLKKLSASESRDAVLTIIILRSWPTHPSAFDFLDTFFSVRTFSTVSQHGHGDRKSDKNIRKQHQWSFVPGVYIQVQDSFCALVLPPRRAALAYRHAPASKVARAIQR